MVVADTCSIWNVLSSRRLFQAARTAKVHFCITEMVHFECVLKPRKTVTAEQDELLRRFRAAASDGCFPVQACTLEDLIQVSRGAPSALSSGELSCIATAYKIRSIAFMTDEKKARKYADKTLGILVETTPRLYAWLHYSRYLSDGDHEPIIIEHERYERRPLTSFLRIAYEAAIRSAAMDRIEATGSVSVAPNEQT